MEPTKETNGTMTAREMILAAPDLSYETVRVAEWGLTLIIREMTAAQRDDYERELLTEQRNEDGEMELHADLHNAKAKLLVKCLWDDAGNRVFTDADAEALGGKSANIVSMLYGVAARLSGLGPKDEEELAKN